MSQSQQSFQLPQAGPEHAVFQKDVGTWEAQVEVRPGPGAPPQRSQGTMVARLVSGGRWLVTEYKNEESGFEGHGLYGWDSAKQKYTGTWVDNMRTTLVLGEGTWDAAARTMTFQYEMNRPDGGLMRWREVTETRGADTQVFRSIISLPDGTDFEMMTATYTRRR
jgi:Protein of unknown function (DUF1579)